MLALRNAFLASKKKSDFAWLTFTAKEAGSTVRIHKTGSPTAASFDYSTDNGGTWSQYTIDDTISLANIGDSVCFAASDGVTNTTIGNGLRAFHRFQFTGNIAQTGSILSLVNKDKDTALGTTLGASCFRSIFSGASQASPNAAITEAQLILYGKNLSSSIFSLAYMFRYNANLSKITTDVESWSIGNFSYWVEYVSATGEFHCPTSLGTNASIQRGIDRCPEGWTVINDV